MIAVSNPFVERIFSCMNLVKTKLRNKMQYKMFDSLIRVKFKLNNSQICCNKYIDPDKMVNKFYYESMYKQNDVNNPDEFAVSK